MKGPEDTRGLQLTLAVYFVVFAMKLTAYFMSGMIVLLAEAFHTLADIFVSGFLLLASNWSRKEADADHMFGHGRAQNIAALVAATLFISFTSLRLYEEAFPRLFSTEETSYQNMPLALGVVVASMVLAAVPLIGLFRRKERGAAAKAQLMELINDELGLLAALVGTLFILSGYPLADPIAAISSRPLSPSMPPGSFGTTSPFCWDVPRGQSFWLGWKNWPAPFQGWWEFTT